MKSKNIVCCRCGQIICNRRVFAQFHAKLHASSPVEQEKIVVDSIYGEDVVSRLVQDYKDEKTCISQMLPIDIAKYLLLLGLKRTSKEERQTRRYKESYLKAIQEMYGAEITNISQVREIQAKKELACAKKYGSYAEYLAVCRAKMKDGYDTFCSDTKGKSKRIKRIKQSFMKKYGVENASQIDSVRDRISKKAKERMMALSKSERQVATQKARKSVPHNWSATTKIEQIVIDGLLSLGYKPKTHLKMGRYSIDIVIGDKAIEVQGDVYHANPKLYNAEDEVLKGTFAKSVWERDKRKKEQVENNGYTLIALWESEIRANKTRIKEWLIEKGINQQEN